MLCKPQKNQWFCWSLSLWKMAISLGVYPIFRHTHLMHLMLVISCDAVSSHGPVENITEHHSFLSLLDLLVIALARKVRTQDFVSWHLEMRFSWLPVVGEGDACSLDSCSAHVSTCIPDIGESPKVSQSIPKYPKVSQSIPKYPKVSQSIPKYCIPARKSYAHHLCASLWPYPRVAATPLSLLWMTWMTPRLNGPMPRFGLHQQSMSYQSYHVKRVAFASCIHLALFSYLFWTGAALLTRWERCADDPTGRSTRCRVLPGGSTL